MQGPPPKMHGIKLKFLAILRRRMLMPENQTIPPRGRGRGGGRHVGRGIFGKREKIKGGGGGIHRTCYPPCAFYRGEQTYNSSPFLANIHNIQPIRPCILSLGIGFLRSTFYFLWFQQSVRTLHRLWTKGQGPVSAVFPRNASDYTFRTPLPCSYGGGAFCADVF